MHDGKLRVGINAGSMIGHPYLGGRIRGAVALYTLCVVCAIVSPTISPSIASSIAPSPSFLHFILSVSSGPFIDQRLENLPSLRPRFHEKFAEFGQTTPAFRGATMVGFGCCCWLFAWDGSRKGSRICIRTVS